MPQLQIVFGVMRMLHAAFAPVQFGGPAQLHSWGVQGSTEASSSMTIAAIRFACRWW